MSGRERLADPLRGRGTDDGPPIREESGPASPSRASIPGTPPLAITGIGVVSPFGTTPGSLVEGIASGANAVKEIEPTGRPGRRIAVVHCDGFDAAKFLPPMKVRRWDPCCRFAAVASKLALEESGLERGGGERVGILASTWSAGATPLVDFLATMYRVNPEAAPPMLFPFTVANAPASQAAIELGLRGPIATLSHRAVVFADSLLYAGILLEDGRADAIVVVATDEVNPTYLRAWDDLGLVAAPGRTGWVLGEGGYAVVVERPEAAAARGAKIHALVTGIGFDAGPEGPHSYSHDPEAYLRSDRDALARAGRSPSNVDFVVLSDNGRPAEAEVERAAFDRLFAGLAPPAAVRWKRALGEGAAPSAAQALVAALAVESGSLPPDRGGALPGNPATAATDPRSGLVHFTGAGGAIFSVVVERASEAMKTRVFPIPEIPPPAGR